MFLLVCLTATVNAQYTVGVFGGINNSNLTGDAPTNVVYKSTPEYGTGLLAEYNITGDVRISFQPMFQRKGTIIAYSVFSEREPIDSIDINISYFSIPVLLKVYGGNNIMYVSGGFDLGIKFDASFRDINSSTELNVEDSFKDFDIAAIIGVGAQFRVGLLYVFIEGRYSQGLSNIRNQKEGEPEDLNLSLRTLGMQLFAGITYSFDSVQ